MKKIVSLILLATLLFACKVDNKNKKDGSLRIVCTTSMIGDCIKNIVTKDIEVVSLMGAGVDPHLYDPRPSDLKALDDADVIIYNGFFLEGKFIDKFKKLEKEKQIISLSQFVEDKAIKDTAFMHSVDPHFWHNPLLWSTALSGVSKKLQSIASAQKDSIALNTKNYLEQINTSYQHIKQDIESIPEENRVLITSHDAFSYFGQCYNIDIKSLQGISTVTESGLKQVTNLAQFIIENKVPSVFVETSVSHRSLESVKENCAAQGYTLNIAEELFSDALGESGKTGGTYLDMLLENAHRIKRGLSNGY